jgi:hypothetical protein
MRKPSPAMIVALLSLFVALGGAGMAATGGNFILGKTNSAMSTTSLSAPLGGKALQVSNASTTAGASTLGLNVASGHAPFTVNSAVKVANLNAAKLDGIDSTGFVRGRGTFLANRLVFVPTNTKTLLTIPGLGYLQANCYADAYITWINTTAGNVDAWRDLSNSHFEGFIIPPGTGLTIADRSANTWGTLALGVGNDPNPRRRCSPARANTWTQDGPLRRAGRRFRARSKFRAPPVHLRRVPRRAFPYHDFAWLSEIRFAQKPSMRPVGIEPTLEIGTFCSAVAPPVAPPPERVRSVPEAFRPEVLPRSVSRSSSSSARRRPMWEDRCAAWRPIRGDTPAQRSRGKGG